jgi:diphthine-ammonia ligase
VIDAQAEAVGIPIVYEKTSWEDYEEKFKDIVKHLKALGVEGGVFGDIKLQEHREWVERVCSDVGIKALEPLWGEAYEELIKEFLTSGFEATIVSIKASLIKEEWLGQNFGWKFIEFLKSNRIDLLGENGEYHTLVTYGPIFKKRIKIVESEKIQAEERWILKVSKIDLL